MDLQRPFKGEASSQLGGQGGDDQFEANVIGLGQVRSREGMDLGKLEGRCSSNEVADD